METSLQFADGLKLLMICIPTRLKGFQDHGNGDAIPQQITQREGTEWGIAGDYTKRG
jgi:hypothetical protein